MFKFWPQPRHCRVLFACILIVGAASQVVAADKAQINTAVQKAVSYLSSVVDQQGGGARSICALALLKGGVPADNPAIQKAVEEVRGRISDNVYRPTDNKFYEPGLDVYLLAEAGGEKYKSEIQAIVDHMVNGQLAGGAWDYPKNDPTTGDTSCTHYCCLGLWAAQRAGIEIDASVWEKILTWHVKRQSRDGGYAYCPGFPEGFGQGKSELNMTVNAIGSVHIAALMLDPNIVLTKPPVPAEKTEEQAEKVPFQGLLERVEIGQAPMNGPRTEGTVPPGTHESMQQALGYLQSRFIVKGPGSGWMGYYYYSLERMAALADLDKIGNRNWFDECANELLSQQRDDGAWKVSRMPHINDALDTAFAILFLTRSTGKLLKRVDTPKFGDGLLAGGRGLPDDLSDVDFNGRKVMKKEEPTEPLDILLASLSKTGGLENLDGVQEKIVEQVQLGNREDLVGQVDQLLKLIDHPDAGIRQTVVWALGRTGNMNLAQHLINKLSDQDLLVMIEARNALCWISRKPLGFGFPEDPLIDLAPNASAEQKRAAIAQWHKNVVLTWGEWYLKNRPFEDRGDAFEAELRQKMDRLKYGF